MIIVNIDVPILGQTLDFQMDENIPMYEVQEEIVDIICRKNSCELIGEEQRLLMWDAERNILLQRDKSGSENGLKSGSHLILV
jgi:hypothetical protein